MSNITVSSNNPGYITSCLNTIRKNKGKLAAGVAVGATAAVAAYALVGAYTLNKNINLLTAELAVKCSQFPSSSSVKNDCEQSAAKVSETCFSQNSGQCDQLKRDFLVLSNRANELIDSYNVAGEACRRFGYFTSSTEDRYCIKELDSLVKECLRNSTKHSSERYDWNLIKEDSCKNALKSFEHAKQIFDDFLAISDKDCSNLNDDNKRNCMVRALTQAERINPNR